MYNISEFFDLVLTLRSKIFSKDIFTFLSLKSETSAHVQLAVISLNILFTNSITWYKLETYIDITLDKWGIYMT